MHMGNKAACWMHLQSTNNNYLCKYVADDMLVLSLWQLIIIDQRCHLKPRLVSLQPFKVNIRGSLRGFSVCKGKTLCRLHLFKDPTVPLEVFVSVESLGLPAADERLNVWKELFFKESKVLFVHHIPSLLERKSCCDVPRVDGCSLVRRSSPRGSGNMMQCMNTWFLSQLLLSLCP